VGTPVQEDDAFIPKEYNIIEQYGVADSGLCGMLVEGIDALLS
jgi:hypothetical protein